MLIKISKSLFFFVISFSFGQNIQTKKAINAYVSQVNSCVYYISLSHYAVKDYNVAINKRINFPNQYYKSNTVFDFYDRDIASIHNTNLSAGKIIHQFKETIENLKTLRSNKGEQLIKSLQNFQKLFEEFVVMNVNFNTKNSLNNYYFTNKENFKILIEELEQYKQLVNNLRKKVDAISQLSTTLYSEGKLPSAIERSKKTVLVSKKVVQSFREQNQIKITTSLKELHNLLQEKETENDQLNLQNAIEFPLSNSNINGASNRALIKSMAQSLYKKALAFSKGKSPKYQKNKNARFQFYTKKDAFQQMLKIEALLEWLNDDFLRTATVIGNYNHVTKVKTPILKIVNMLIPFELLPLSEDDSGIITQVVPKKPIVKENHSLAGAKINNLVLLLDVSASMKNDKKLEKLKNSINYLIDLLRKEDKLSIIIYSENPKILFSSKGGYKKSDLKLKIDKLKTGGGTNTKKGLQKAYQLCNKLKITNGNNRIIIATDGFFKIDKKDKTLIKNNVVKEIYLSAFHYKSSKKNKKEEKTLKKMSKIGQGVYKVIKNNKDALMALVDEAKQF